MPEHPTDAQFSFTFVFKQALSNSQKLLRILLTPWLYISTGVFSVLCALFISRVARYTPSSSSKNLSKILALHMQI